MRARPWLEATGDTLDLTAFYDRVGQIAADLADAGDTDPLGARKAKALGVLARQGLNATSRIRPHRAAEAAVLCESPRRTCRALLPDRAARPRRRRHPGLRPGRETRARPGGGHRVLGAHLTRHHHPVLDLNRRRAVDGPTIPAAMREQVVQRDKHCVLPYCTIDARACDLDHINPYRPWTKADHPAKPTPTTSPPSAGDTTAPKPAADGATDATPPPATTTGPAPTTATTSPPR